MVKPVSTHKMVQNVWYRFCALQGTEDHVLNADFAAFIQTTRILWPPALIILIESPMNWSEIIH